MSELTLSFPCYTALGRACWAAPYEELLDRLTATIGPDAARAAFRVIGAHATHMGSHQMLSSLLKAYGDNLTASPPSHAPDSSAEVALPAGFSAVPEHRSVTTLSSVHHRPGPQAAPTTPRST